MRNPIAALILFISAWFVLSSSVSYSADWSGVDETVIERFAAEAGRHAADPLINTDQGDLLLFVFLLAGAAGGFMMGYFFRALFHEPRRAEQAGAMPRS